MNSEKVYPLKLGKETYGTENLEYLLMQLLKSNKEEKDPQKK